MPQIYANEIISNCNAFKKYNKEVQRSIQSLPKINEATIGNHQLVVRSKNNSNDKWVNSYYPFYWASIGTIDLDSSYIIIRANKSNFAESKYSLGALEYQNDDSIIGFTQINILKNSKTRKKIIGFQYKLDNAILENDKTWHATNLQHVILIDVDNHKYKQFIYDSNATLLCYQINNDTYIESKNLLVNTNDLKLEPNDSCAKTLIKAIKKATCSTFAFVTWFIKGDN